MGNEGFIGVNGSICVGLRMRVVWVLRAWLNLM